jgi:predicted lipase
MTLNNIGVLDTAQNRMNDARRAFEEALKIYRDSAKQSPERYQTDVERVEKLLKGLDAKSNPAK